MPPSPGDVFTPRRHEINPLTYVARTQHELDLERALRGNLHIALPGLSGSGKSWLYKGLFGKQGIRFDTLNLANASRHQSIDAVVKSKLGEHGVGLDQTSVSSNEVGLSNSWFGGFKKVWSESKMQPALDLVAIYFQFLKMRSGGKKTVLVLENFETISDNRSLLRQLSELIVLVDDAYYGQFDIQLLIVGASSNILQLIEAAASVPTVSNRIRAMREVGPLEDVEAYKIINQGFQKLELPLLGNQVQRGICWHADNIAQHVQQICYEIADASVEDRAVTSRSCNRGIKSWISSHLMSDLDDVSSHLSAEKANHDVRRVLYALGQSSDRNNTSLSLISTMKTGAAIKGTPLSSRKIEKILATLSNGNKPLLHRPEGRNYFCFIKPTYRMVLRSTTAISTDGTIQVIDPKGGENIFLPNLHINPIKEGTKENLSHLLIDAEDQKKGPSIS